MSCILSNRSTCAIAAAFMVAAATAAPLDAQEAARVVSSEFTVSGANAAMELELAGGRNVALAIRDGGAYIDGVRIGDAARGSALDRAWRDLLSNAMDAVPSELPQLLTSWSAEGDAGSQLDAALEAAFQSVDGDAAAATVAPAAPINQDAQVTPGSDSLSRLVDRISELEQELEAREVVRVEVPRRGRAARMVDHFVEGVVGIFSTLIGYVVLFGIGFVTILFGGRKYIEGVADTARNATGRSFLVGLAAAFLVGPVFVLGVLALLISVIGIPGLLVWVPGFPVAAVLAALLGYLGVAHAAGEGLAERRFYVTDWFQRGNSYYFLLSGLGLLIAPFLAAQVVHMAGPWLRPIYAILNMIGVAGTIAVMMIGLGAVLVSRGGKRPVRKDGTTGDVETDLFTEDANV